MNRTGSGTEAVWRLGVRGNTVQGWHSPPSQRQIPIYTHLHFKRDCHISLLRQQLRPTSEAVR
jgi:hypothetical protein